MRSRHRVFSLAAGAAPAIVATAIVAAVLIAAALETAAQTPRRSGTRTWTPPLTSDGHPDLQGVWVIRSATPVERPKALEGRTLLTDEEVEELKRRADRLFKSGNSDFAAGARRGAAARESRRPAR